ncbi:MAG: hypothetical protein J7J17_02885 [Hadesarchaea archaeon]|nr:hypothetical protein [Hadesarchaea archaeon]
MRNGDGSESFEGHPGFPHVAVGQAGAVVLGAVFWLAVAGLLEPGAYGQVNWPMSLEDRFKANLHWVGK